MLPSPVAHSQRYPTGKSPLRINPTLDRLIISTQQHPPRSRLSRTFFVVLLVFATIHLSGWLRQPSFAREAGELARPDFKPYEPSAVEPGRSTTFRSYLRAKLPPDSSGTRPSLWLTTADRRSIRTSAVLLHQRVLHFNAKRTLQTALVVLCADRECLEECKARLSFLCYAGYTNTKPIRMRMEPWMQLSGIIDALESYGDVLFVHPDTVVGGNPLPSLQQQIDSCDLVAIQNGTQISSHFIWSHNSSSAITLWHEVLERAETGESADVDVLLNAVLEDIEERARGDSEETGVRVHALDPHQFNSFSLSGTDLATLTTETPLVSQLSCAGDALYRDYISKVKGLHLDLQSYYSSPHPLLQIPAMVGTREELTQLLKVAIMAAKLTGRSLLPPPTVTFLDVLSSATNEPTTLPIYAAFPLPYLSRALSFSLVEPSYPAHALSVLSDPLRPAPSAPSQIKNATRVVSALAKPTWLDIRKCDDLFDLVRLLTMSPHSDALTVQLDALSASPSFTPNWRRWPLPLPGWSRIVQPCRRLESVASSATCGEVCSVPKSWTDGILPHEYEWEDRGVLLAREMAKRIEEPLPPLKEFLMEGGFSKDD
ncbi:hypothetical protein JCM8097_007614 [Rhodosporidiobolus ruineniae]